MGRPRPGQASGIAGAAASGGEAHLLLGGHRGPGGEGASHFGDFLLLPLLVEGRGRAWAGPRGRGRQRRGPAAPALHPHPGSGALQLQHLLPAARGAASSMWAAQKRVSGRLRGGSQPPAARARQPPRARRLARAPPRARPSPPWAPLQPGGRLTRHSKSSGGGWGNAGAPGAARPALDAFPPPAARRQRSAVHSSHKARGVAAQLPRVHDAVRVQRPLQRMHRLRSEGAMAGSGSGSGQATATRTSPSRRCLRHSSSSGMRGGAGAATWPAHLQRGHAVLPLQVRQLAVPHAVLPRARAAHVLRPQGSAAAGRRAAAG